MKRRRRPKRLVTDGQKGWNALAVKVRAKGCHGPDFVALQKKMRPYLRHTAQRLSHDWEPVLSELEFKVWGVLRRWNRGYDRSLWFVNFEKYICGAIRRWSVSFVRAQVAAPERVNIADRDADSLPNVRRQTVLTAFRDSRLSLAMAKATDFDLLILKRLAYGDSMGDVARDYGMDKSTISRRLQRLRESVMSSRNDLAL